MTRKLVLALAAICGLIVIGYFVYRFDFFLWDFRNNLWAPAYLLVHGKSPYHISLLFDYGNAVWFPQIIVFFFPLGFLPEQQASNLWLMINVLTIICLTIYLARKNNLKTTHLLTYGIIFLSVFLFPPTTTYIMFGQVDFLLMTAILISVWEIDKQNAKTAAFGFALALAKPQVCFVVIPTAFIWLILKKKWKFSLELFIYLIFFLLLLMLPLWFADPNWITDFMQNLHRNPSWSQPVPFTQLQILFGHKGLLLWLAAAIACIIAGLILWNRLGPQQAVLWSLALTTIAAPYIWSWDFTLLLPLWIDTLTRLTNVYARIILAISWLICFFFTIWTRQIEWSDGRLWWLPFVMLLGIVTSLLVDQKNIQKSAAFTPKAI